MAAPQNSLIQAAAEPTAIVGTPWPSDSVHHTQHKEDYFGEIHVPGFDDLLLSGQTEV